MTPYSEEMSDETPAPDFPRRDGSASNYPSRGERIGPMWEWLWQRMAGHGHYLVGELIAEALEVTGSDLAPKTVENLLYAAARAKVIGIGWTRWNNRNRRMVWRWYPGTEPK